MQLGGPNMYEALGSMSGMTKEKTKNYYQYSDSSTGLLSQHKEAEAGGTQTNSKPV